MSMYIFHLSPFLSYDLFKCSDLARSVFVNSTVFVSGPKSALVVAMCCVVRLRSFHEPVMKIGLRFIFPGLIWRDCKEVVKPELLAHSVNSKTSFDVIFIAY